MPGIFWAFPNRFRLSWDCPFPYFEPARQLYRKFGFRICPPFGNYIEDANSVFMSMELGANIETIIQGQLDAYKRAGHRGTDVDLCR